MPITRIPNWKINEQVQDLNEFTNYNSTIVAVRTSSQYVIVHWNTTILRYNFIDNKIEFLLEDYRSQTTSTLIGRLIRSLPRQSVIDYITGISNKDNRQRLRRMLGRIDPEIW